MLSFDEFRVATDREKSKQKLKTELQKNSEVKPIENPTGELGNRLEDKKKSSWSLGEFLEMHQMQLFVIILIFLDIFASFGEVYIQSVTSSSDREVDMEKNNMFAFSKFHIMKILAAFTGFTILFFAVELLAIVAVFKFSTFGHIGYIIDMAVVTGQLYFEINGFGKETRILNMFRLWRVIRLFNSMVNLERDLHDATRVLLEQQNANIMTFEAEIKRLKVEFVKEKEARDSVELMLQGYKEEVDTLNEALKIAAMDIAEVAQADDDYLVSDDDDEYGDEGESDIFMDAASSEVDRSRNKEILYKAARRDTNASRETSSQRSQGVTFVVHEDGSFKKR